MTSEQLQAILTDLRRRRRQLPTQSTAPAEQDGRRLSREEWIARNKREYEARRKAKR